MRSFFPLRPDPPVFSSAGGLFSLTVFFRARFFYVGSQKRIPFSVLRVNASLCCMLYGMTEYDFYTITLKNPFEIMEAERYNLFKQPKSKIILMPLVFHQRYQHRRRCTHFHGTSFI